MTMTTKIQNGQESQVEQIFVKWADPFEELNSVAQLCEIINYRTIAEPGQICIVVPNATWGLQIKEACSKAGVEAVLRIPKIPLSAQAKKGFTMLGCLAQPQNAQARDSWIKTGRTEAELDELVEKYTGASAMSIFRMTGLSECVELEHARLHAHGDESFAELYKLMFTEWQNPTSPEGVHKIEIVHYMHIARTYEQMFFIGCVDGLIPGSAVYAEEAAKAQEDTSKARKAFVNAINHATKRVFISGFQKTEADFAQRAHLHYIRTRTENGRSVVLANPTPFLNDLGSCRPSTMGGQALMRRFKLN